MVNSATVSSSTSDDVTTNNSASATTAITRSADLVAGKTGPAGTITAGQAVTYTVTATNNGPSTATNVRLTDQIPVGAVATPAPGVVAVPGAVTPTCVMNGTTASCTIASLGPNQTITATVSYTLGSGFSGASVSNAATVSADTPDPSSANNTATVSNTVARSADVVLTKSVSSPTAAAGTGVTYTLTVSNSGLSDAQAVTVADPAVAGLTIISAAPSRGTCTITAGNLSCDIGLLSPASSATIIVKADVAPDFAGTTLVNAATATSTTTDPNPANNTNITSSLTVTKVADVAIVKTGPATITANTDQTYVLTITNTGPSQAIGVTAADVLGSGLTFVSGGGNCTAAGTTVTCAVGTLAVNQTVTRTFVVHAPGTVPDPLANTATITSTSTDPNAANNSSTFTSSAQNLADISVTKAQSPTTLVAGGPVTYTMLVTNNGPSPATTVQLTDTLPSNVTITTLTPVGGATCDPAPAVHCTATTLASGASFTVVVAATVAASTPAGTVLTNNVAVTSASPLDPTQSNNTASVSGTVTTSADVGVTLTADTPTINAGATETYRLHVVNNGPSVARNVVATGQVPPGLIPVVGSSGGACVLTGQIVTCRLGDLPPGFVSSPDITLQAIVDPSDPAGPILGTAFIGSDTPDPINANNSDPETITVTTSADLAITKAAPATLVAGGEATYTLTVVNNGPSDASAVSVGDTLNAAFTSLSASSSLGACGVTGQTVTCNAARLPTGSTMVVTVKVKISATATGPIGNTATVSAATPDPTPGNNSSTTSTPVSQQAHLSLTKSAAPSPAVAGAAITYTLTLANSGPSTAVNVATTDSLPSGLLVLPNGVNGPAGACTVTADNVTVNCNFASIPSGESRVVTIAARVPAATPPSPTPITNIASVTSSGTPDPDHSGWTASVDTLVGTSADVTILKTPLDTGVVAGDQHGYLLAVTNDGPSVARAVTASDALPDGTTFVSAVPSLGTCTGTPATMSCSFGDLTPGQVVTVQLTISLAASLGDTTLTNTATASSSTDDPDTTNNSSTVSQRVNRRADMQVTKRNSSGPVVAGTNVTYTLTTTNNGPSDTISARIVDPVPAGTTFVSALPSDDGTCVLSPTPPPPAIQRPDQVECTWPTLLVRGTRSAQITFAVPDGAAAGTLTNTATSDSAAIDPKPTTATATVSDDLQVNSDLSVTKSLLSGTPTAGGPVRWQLSVRNAGPSVATGVTVSDVAPAGVTFDDVSPSGSCAIGAAPLCTLGTLPVGGTATITLVGTIAANYPGDSVTNTATVSSTSTDADPTDNTGSSTTPVDTSADLSVDKTPLGTFVAGSTAQWTLAVTNHGPSAARSAVVDDPVPVGIVNVSAPGCTVGVSVNCPLGNLASGQTVTVTVSGTITADYLAGSVTNAATTSSGTSDPFPNNNSDSVASDVGTSADVRIAKSGPVAAAPGEDVAWQIAVDNAGPSVAQGVVVTETLPPDLLTPRVTLDGASCSIDAGVATCQLGAVPVSDRTSLTAQVVTVSGTIDPASTRSAIVNTATVATTTTRSQPRQ